MESIHNNWPEPKKIKSNHEKKETQWKQFVYDIRICGCHSDMKKVLDIHVTFFWKLKTKKWNVRVVNKKRFHQKEINGGELKKKEKIKKKIFFNEIRRNQMHVVF